jgi:hypothetical protein
MWFMVPSSMATTGYLVCKYLSVVYRASFNLSIAQTLLPRLQVSTGGQYVSQTITAANAIQPGALNHILVGRDHAAGVLRMFINGVAAASEVSSPTALYSAAGSALIIGAREDNAKPFPYPIFDARLYNAAPTLEMAQALYYGHGTDGIIDGLVLRTCINNGIDGASLSGATVYDHSIFGNHITATGAPAVSADPYPTVKSPVMVI